MRESLKVNAPLSSGAGRLFDAASALLGRARAGQLRGSGGDRAGAAGRPCRGGALPCREEDGRILGADLIACVHDDLGAGRDRAEIAAAFHEGVALAFAEACARAAEPKTVVLSGGCFQNLRLLASSRRRLEEQRLPRSRPPPASAQRRLHLLRSGSYRCDSVQPNAQCYVPRNPSPDRRDRRPRGQNGQSRDRRRAAYRFLRAARGRGEGRRVGADPRRLRARPHRRGGGARDAAAFERHGRGLRARAGSRSARVPRRRSASADEDTSTSSVRASWRARSSPSSPGRCRRAASWR